MPTEGRQGPHHMQQPRPALPPPRDILLSMAYVTMSADRGPMNLMASTTGSIRLG